MGNGRSCTPVSCPSSTTLSIANGTVSTANGAIYEQKATYTCNPGYRLVGVASRSCEAEGTWNGSAPSCEPRDCGTLPMPAHGRVDLSGGTTVASPPVRFSCDAGYTRYGDETRTCQPTILGVGWSGSAPSCLKCGDGIVSREVGEECDPKASGTTAWNCDQSSCKKATMYSSCLGDAECNAGEQCAPTGYCARSCVSAGTCPARPAGINGAAPFCAASGTCALTCNSELDCAPGLLCTGGACTGCVPGFNTCPASLTCYVPSGRGAGRCQ
jgi:hypothetical protein